MNPTILGLPARDVSNLLQNIAMMTLAIVASRGHMSGDMVDLWSGLIGSGVALASNYLTMRTGAGTASTSLPNGADKSVSAGA